ncbi:uncharacterized protein BDV17DRAFT_295683 [Aspergillus undulatus]|uniref:uncharacterized protein n=1 Tax=Aspergillus undulatus TaxID=1810928 RepID=UPI003CCD5CAE
MWANLLPGGIQAFDHKFFDKSKREASALDPHQRLLLETTYQALEAAGLADAALETHEGSSTTTGCFSAWLPQITCSIWPRIRHRPVQEAECCAPLSPAG